MGIFLYLINDMVNSHLITIDLNKIKKFCPTPFVVMAHSPKLVGKLKNELCLLLIHGRSSSSIP